MDTREKLNNIKEYISRIEEDVILSYNNDCYNSETLMNKNILECLKAVSELLEDVVSRFDFANGRRFFITDEQQDELRIISHAKITDIANEINRVTENNNTSKITTTWITDWLISVNVLEVNNSGERVPTKIGKDIGISSQPVQIAYNKMQNINYYSKDAQMFIYENIESIINFHYNSRPESDSKKSKSRFFITDEQRKQIQIISHQKISQIADELNRVTQENNMKKLQAVWITDWLFDIGMLQKNAEGNRIATESGKAKGITSQLKKSSDGREYYLNYYSEKAQEFIYDNINNIIVFHYDHKNNFKTEYKLLEYPYGKPINKFISENSNKCIIISVGSCNCNISKGSYKVVLIYNDDNRFLYKDNIKTRSANQCILHGLKDAVHMIKIPTDVILLTSTTLGFKSPQSTNYSVCRDIIDILNEKDCTVNITNCNGMGEELRNYVTFLQKQQKKSP